MKMVMAVDTAWARDERRWEVTMPVCWVQAHAKFIVYAAACQDAAVRELITETEQPFLRCVMSSGV